MWHPNPAANRMVQERGPRYAVIGSIRQGESAVDYADTAEVAEMYRQSYEDSGYYQVKVHPPIGSIDLAKLGRDRADANRAYGEKTAILKAAVLRAIEDGRAEAEIARTAGIDRMTVRTWAGKK